MHSWLTRILASALTAASIAAAPVALAVASPRQDAHRAARVQRVESAETGHEAERSGEPGGGESDGDGAAQAAACAKAGVSGDNVQYDDQTGTCTANAGADSQQQN